jgi:hypothetical protein
VLGDTRVVVTQRHRAERKSLTVDKRRWTGSTQPLDGGAPMKKIFGAVAGLAALVLSAGAGVTWS